MLEAGRVSIIIPTVGKLPLLDKLLLSLRENSTSPGEILIVDNTRESIQRYSQIKNKYNDLDLQVTQEPRNGLHFARHAGALAAKSDLLVYIDDDVICPKGWLEKLLDPFHDPSVACVGGKTVGKFEVPPPGWVKDFPAYLSLLDLGGEERDISFPQETLFGCNFAVRKDVLLAVGGFNPDGFSNPAYYWYRGDGETGLQRKIYQVMRRMVYSPDAWLYHQIPASRLTEEYLIKRAQTQAVSDGFSYYRTHTNAAALVKGLVLCLWLPVREMVSPAKNSFTKSLWSKMRRSYWKYRLIYARKILTHPGLVAFTRSENYWDKP